MVRNPVIVHPRFLPATKNEGSLRDQGSFVVRRCGSDGKSSAAGMTPQKLGDLRVAPPLCMAQRGDAVVVGD